VKWKWSPWAWTPSTWSPSACAAAGVEKHPRAVALDDLVTVAWIGRVVDLELDAVVRLRGGDPQRAHLLQRDDRILVDLQHPASVENARPPADGSGAAREARRKPPQEPSGEPRVPPTHPGHSVATRY
jgi:hypothetical protein